MAKFGNRSLKELQTCSKVLRLILTQAIELYDFSVLKGFRGEQEQNKAYREGKSKLQYPESKHNQTPSRAVDIAPYPIDWEDKKRFYYLAGLIKGIAHAEGVKIRWGGDWDRDGDFDDQSFNDLPHFELVD